MQLTAAEWSGAFLPLLPGAVGLEKQQQPQVPAHGPRAPVARGRGAPGEISLSLLSGSDTDVPVCLRRQLLPCLRALSAGGSFTCGRNEVLCPRHRTAGVPARSRELPLEGNGESHVGWAKPIQTR